MSVLKMTVATPSVAEMSMPRSRFRYGPVAQLFHWLTVVLVGTAYIVSPGGREDRIYSAAFDFSRQLHETIGILVFGLVLLRILWRLVEPAPEGSPMAPWMKYSASAAHLGLYALLLAIPLTAIAGAWLEAHPLTIFGVGTIGPMLAPDHDLGQTIAYISHDPGKRHSLAGGTAWRRRPVPSFHSARQCLTSMLPAWCDCPRRASAGDVDN